jgi:hypothetical protein
MIASDDFCFFDCSLGSLLVDLRRILACSICSLLATCRASLRTRSSKRISARATHALLSNEAANSSKRETPVPRAKLSNEP